MKLKTKVASSMFVIAALISTGGFAASDGEKSAESKPAATESKKKVKPHSHVEERGGAVSSVAPKESDHKEAKVNPAQDRTKHFHPRDGK